MLRLILEARAGACPGRMVVSDYRFLVSKEPVQLRSNGPWSAEN